MNENNINTLIMKDFTLSPSLIKRTVVNNGRTLMCPNGTVAVYRNRFPSFPAFNYF